MITAPGARPASLARDRVSDVHFEHVQAAAEAVHRVHDAALVDEHVVDLDRALRRALAARPARNRRSPAAENWFAMSYTRTPALK